MRLFNNIIIICSDEREAELQFQKNNNCSAKDLENGKVIPLPKTTRIAAVTFLCYPGYYLIGQYVSECEENGNWTGKWPSCIGKNN